MFLREMTLKNKIAATFALITSCILIVVCCMIYYLFQQSARNDFFQRLNERAGIIATFLLEKDELNINAFSEIKEKYFQELPHEQEFLINLDNLPNWDTLPAFVNGEFIESVEERQMVSRMAGEVAVLGKYYNDNQGDFAVVVTAKDGPGIQKLNRLGRILIIVVLGSMALIFALGRWYAEEMLFPLKAMIRKMHDIDTNNLYLRIEEGQQQDEVSQLARAFNKLLNRIETSIESQNNFISSASHELKTPLTAILGELEVGLRGERSAEEYRQCLLLVEREAERLKALTLRLLHLAQAGVPETGRAFAPLRFDELVLEVAENEGHNGAGPNVLLHFDGLPPDPQELEVMGSANLLKIALSNILGNAVKFSGGKPVEVFFTNYGDHIEVEVRDKGIGIPKESAGQVFTPFFRAENARDIEGFGVGLPLVKKIIDIHEGEVALESELGRGTTVHIILPKGRF
ncbi:MAG: HAMP domain-containing histidine kinase [Phaeodactylibacter sp.]|nr:HAMP domain-containing histidine kinase [Phaeodactylibacter sp.]